MPLTPSLVLRRPNFPFPLSSLSSPRFAATSSADAFAHFPPPFAVEAASSSAAAPFATSSPVIGAHSRTGAGAKRETTDAADGSGAGGGRGGKFGRGDGGGIFRRDVGREYEAGMGSVGEGMESVGMGVGSGGVGEGSGGAQMKSGNPSVFQRSGVNLPPTEERREIEAFLGGVESPSPRLAPKEK